MGDPLSVAASAAGLLSLGIQVSQSLVSFYLTCKGQDEEIERIIRNLKSLGAVFQSVEEAVKDRTFREDERTLVVQIDDLIQDCDEIILEMRDECEKFSKSSTNGFRAAVKATGRRCTYPFKQSTIAKLDEDIKGIRSNLLLALEVLTSRNSSRIENETEEIKSVLDLVRTSQVSSAIRNWLNAPDATINYNEAYAKRHPATGLWFVNNSTFTTWLERENSFLWLNGFAGCGKSVLSSTTIQFTFRHWSSNLHIGVAFFYFTFNDDSKQDVSGMLRALLLQLSNQLDDSYTDLADLHNRYRDGVPPIPVLMESLRRLIQKFQDVYVIIDALDESPRHEKREHVLGALIEFRNWSLRGLHILVTSRDEVDIREQLDPLPDEDVSMKNAGIDKDIENFIAGYLHRSRALRKWSAYHSRIKEALTLGAKGVFRWVECQFKSLATCPRSEDHLEKLLASLPQSLDETYERMLMKIDVASIEYARLILMWLCFAKRPLTVREVIDGVVVELGDNARVNLKRRLQDEDDILQICPGFIHVDTVLVHKKYGQDGMAHTLRIAHYSVQEYLESDRIRQQTAGIFSMQSAISNLEAAQICLVYLLGTVLSDAELTAVTLDKYPFAEYAATYWYEHYKTSEEKAFPVSPIIMRFFEGENAAFQNWIRIHDPDYPYIKHSFWRGADDIALPVYYASLLGLRFVLHELLARKKDEGTHTSKLPKLSSSGVSSMVNAQGGRYGNALQAASWGGQEKTVRLLLDKGADANAQGGRYGNALQAASCRGHEKTVQLLLDRGAEVDTRDGKYGNALQVASWGGHEKTVQLLLDKGAEVNAQGGFYGNTLQAASLGGYEETVQLLVNKGAEVNAQGGFYGNALQAASLGGYEETVEFLLDKNADVNVQGGFYGNALQAASWGGREKTVQLLLDKGADVNAQGGEYGNALQAASGEGHEKTAQLFLNKGAEFNAQYGDYWSCAARASVAATMIHAADAFLCQSSLVSNRSYESPGPKHVG